MSDRQVSIDGHTHPLPRPFLVLATQNPFEYEGTYPLPENQLDRFMMRIQIGYPDREEEKRILSSHRQGEPIDGLVPVLKAEQIVALQESVRQVTVDESINEYIIDLAHLTRTTDELQVGVSTRGALTLYRCAQSLAMVEDRSYVIPDDVKRLALPVLSHRVIAKGYLGNGDTSAAEDVLRRLLDQVAVPT
jgi:MoxR-like ATPase